MPEAAGALFEGTGGVVTLVVINCKGGSQDGGAQKAINNGGEMPAEVFKLAIGPRGPVDRRGPTVTVCRFAAPTATVTGRRRAHRTGPEFRFSHAPLRRRTLFRL